MALPFFESPSRKRDDIIAVDLGSRITKAVHLHRRGQSFALSEYALVDAPIFEKSLSAELLTEHLKAVTHALETKPKTVSLTVGVSDAMVRTVEMPGMPVDDMRMVLKHNSRNYLQQDMTNFLFDCHVLSNGVQGKPAAPAKGQAAAAQKQRVLVAGARKQIVQDYTEGAKNAGLMVDQIVPGLVGPVNAFEKALPEVFATQVVGLVDIGFRNSAICILERGELVLSRVVGIGGDRLTSDLCDSMKISYAEAEGIKLGMPGEVQSHLDMTLIPLGRELRASIDFYEHQHDTAVSQVYVTGGTARSEFLVERLQQELMVECKVLNPVKFLQLEVGKEKEPEVAQVAPQLATALGTALAAL
jgi:type IV pilus assembly protein PilM